MPPRDIIMLPPYAVAEATRKESISCLGDAFGGLLVVLGGLLKGGRTRSKRRQKRPSFHHRAVLLQLCSESERTKEEIYSFLRALT